MLPTKVLLSLLLVPSGVNAFTPQSTFESPTKSIGRSVSALGVGATIDWNPNDEDESVLMQRAVDCANSDSCPLDAAKMCLDDVIRIQSGCQSRTVLGDVCQNIDEAVEVVANLRAKIEKQARQALAVNAGMNVVVALATLVVLAAVSSGMAANTVDSTPFTPQEWWWAIRDGYFPQMVSHYFHHGGLATMEYDSETTPFSMNEWFWATRDGYLPTLIEHYFRNGGLSTSEDFVQDTVAFTPQEWMSAIQGGYLDRMMSYNFENGGLVSSPSASEAISLTPQEVWWAVKGGYAQDVSDHVFRNGGF